MPRAATEARLPEEPEVDRGARAPSSPSTRGSRRAPDARRRGADLSARARGGPAPGPPDGDPVRDLPRARRLQRSVDGAERVDANKRVLYVRNEAGRIVARKLLAISEGLEARRLQPLHLRRRRRGDRDPPCRARRCAGRSPREAGLPLALARNSGRDHQGFWYDDGTVSFDDDVDVVCPLARPRDAAKRFDAIANRGRLAIDVGDVDAVLAVVTRWDAAPLKPGPRVVARRTPGEREAGAARRITIRCALARELWRRGHAAGTVMATCAPTSTRPRMPYPRCLWRFSGAPRAGGRGRGTGRGACTRRVPEVDTTGSCT